MAEQDRIDESLIACEHMTCFFDSFAVPTKRERYLMLVKKKRGLQELAREMNKLDLDYSLSEKIFPNNREKIIRILFDQLVRYGAPSQCIVWGEQEPRGASCSLNMALENNIGCASTWILSSIPGKLAVVETDEKNGLYIFHRKVNQNLNRGGG